MIQYFIRSVKRFALLLPGIVIAYFSIKEIFPYFDQKLPLAFAVLFTYALGAYVLVPGIIRVWRIFRPAKHLPLYCVTPDGFASDPLNIGIVATRRELIKAMQKAGWHMADPHRGHYLLRHVLSTVYGWSYPNAPVSNLYLFGRKQDIAFEIPVAGNSINRHHVRFWATVYDSKKPVDVHTLNRHGRQSHVQADKLLWVGAASLDVGVSYIRHNLQFTHMVDPNTDMERELIVKQLKKQGLAGKIEMVKLGDPYKLINRVMSGSLHTDGRMAIVKLHGRKR